MLLKVNRTGSPTETLDAVELDAVAHLEGIVHQQGHSAEQVVQRVLRREAKSPSKPRPIL